MLGKSLHSQAGRVVRQYAYSSVCRVTAAGLPAVQPWRAHPARLVSSPLCTVSTQQKDESPPKKSTEEASSTASTELKKPGRMYNLLEGVKDVLAVTFGWERRRDVSAEYDMGIRDYPWIEYTDPSTGTYAYKNLDTGVVTDKKPLDFDQRAPPSARVVTNTEASAITVVTAEKTAWERTLNAVSSAPIISSMLEAGKAVAKHEKVVAVKEKLADKIEDAREVWETSQHPLIVNAAYAVDSLTSETEQGRALREIQQLDTGFDMYNFIEEMSNVTVPTLAKAFFKLDMPVLRILCKDSALAQIRAVAAAREVEGLRMDGTILNVNKVEIAQARTLERGVPIILVTAQVQYIHCVKNKKDEIVEGGESEIRATFFVLAVTREYDDKEGKLAWKVVELSMQGSMLYL